MNIIDCNLSKDFGNSHRLARPGWAELILAGWPGWPGWPHQPSQPGTSQAKMARPGCPATAHLNMIIVDRYKLTGVQEREREGEKERERERKGWKARETENNDG